MTVAEAAKLLELPENASPGQIEARFLELRRKLEDKIAKAPTPGLQAKYRETLATITTAFETLTLAADSSTLPVLQRQPAEGEGLRFEDKAATPSPSPHSPPPTSHPTPHTSSAKRQAGGGKEFVLVAVVAVLLLAGGGWFVMKTRADNAEKARIAAEAAAEALRKKQAEEAHAAEVARKATELRTVLATAKVTWETFENRLREAERRTSEAKGELRSFRDGPAWKKAELSALAQRQEMYTNWLNTYLVSHPAKIARAKAEQFLSDKLVDEAAAAVEDMNAGIAEIQEFLPRRETEMLESTVDVSIESMPAGVRFVFTDPYGRTTEGTTPAKLTSQPLSHLHDPKYDGDAGDTEVRLGEFTVEPNVRFIRPGWKDVVVPGRTSAGTADFATEYAAGGLKITSQPSGVPFVATNEFGWNVTGTTPAALSAVPPGPVRVTISRPGFQDVSQTLTVEADKIAQASQLDQRSQMVAISVVEAKAKIFVDGKLAGHEKVSLQDLPPGEHKLQLEASGFSTYRTKFTVKQEWSSKNLAFSFAQLSQPTEVCPSCQGQGYFTSTSTCHDCGGRGRVTCTSCQGRGYHTYEYLGNQTCPYCKGTGREECLTCGGAGKLTDYRDCSTCQRRGRISKLQLLNL